MYHIKKHIINHNNKKIIAFVFISLFLMSPIFFSTFQNVNASEDPEDDDYGETQDGIGWPMFRHDEARTGISTSTKPPTDVVEWISSADGRIMVSSPTVAKGKIYFGTFEQKVYCFNSSDGSHVWNYSTGGNIYPSPAVIDGKVYIGSKDNKIYCLNAVNGNHEWNFTTGDDVCSSPVIVDGYVYIGSHDDNVYCLNAATNNHRVWNYSTGGDVWSSPAVVDGYVYIGSDDHNVYCLDAVNGDLQWHYTTEGPVETAVAVVNEKVYFGSLDSNVYCLDANDGGIIWSYSTGDYVISSPAIFDDKIYFGSFDDKVYCLNATDGSFIWSYTTGGDIRSSPAIADGKVYIGSKDRKMYCLDSEDGTKIWDYTTNGQISSSPAIVNGLLYITTQALSDNIYCFGGENLPPEAPKPVGPIEGEIQAEITFSTSTIDPNGDDIYYNFNWGDGTDSGWLGPYDSGLEIEAIHSYSTEGIFYVKVIARDIYKESSDWSSGLEITIYSSLPDLIIHSQSSVIEGEDFLVNIKSDEAPIENVMVEFNEVTYYTDANGDVTLIAPNVESHTSYLITATKSGYQSDSAWITVLNQVATNQSWIFGNVYSGTLPLENAQILVNSIGKSWSTSTDVSGIYILSVPVGSYDVKASLDGYLSSTKSGITVLPQSAIELNFNLQEIEDYVPEPSQKDLIDYIIETQIDNGLVAAEINVAAEEHNVILYTDKINVDIVSAKSLSKGEITFTFYGEGNSTIFVIYLTGVVTPEEVRLKYDDNAIDRINDISYFFSSQSTDAEWMIYPTDTDYVALLRVPHLSEHSVTIYSVAETISGIMAVIFYVIICSIAGIVFLIHGLSGPVIRFVFKRKK